MPKVPERFLRSILDQRCQKFLKNVSESFNKKKSLQQKKSLREFQQNNFKQLSLGSLSSNAGPLRGGGEVIKYPRAVKPIKQ